MALSRSHGVFSSSAVGNLMIEACDKPNAHSKSSAATAFIILRQNKNNYSNTTIRNTQKQKHAKTKVRKTTGDKSDDDNELQAQQLAAAQQQNLN